MAAWMQGVIMGLSIAAPVGPIGLLCIRTTLSRGKLNGFLCGLGAATADGIYGAVAVLGLTFVTQILVRQSAWIQAAGAVFLVYLAYRTITAPVKREGEIESGGTSPYAGTYFTTLFLTLTNPMTIVSFVGIFAGMKRNAGSEASAMLLVLGVFAGSALWWLLLSSTVGLLRRMVSLKAMRGFNYVSGAVLLGYGLWNLYELLQAGGE
ncbi:LysE family translocator [Cohnella sp. CFH 77786]|uniref:LysE/ArgO family amino acid transporter n=1 Tax=Cohnella sp. CFH 77786 TaxID=2662265 RepID=UPI001C609B90|nr:LysE family translocator [Cohnella sp. CFH 77786]MBW5444458.1 LysE family translocator [Cohnella sp. CFH 77786]